LRRSADMKPKPLKIFSCPQANPDDGEHWAYMMEIGKDEHTAAEHERHALLMRHAPELLYELKATTELFLQVFLHEFEGKPLPMPMAARHVVLDALNVIDLAEGRKTEGTRYYPLPED
jgi:hypothetical protein